MLVLSRKRGEIVHIGADIQVKVIGISRERVRLAFVAPDEMHIVRDEIRDTPPATAGADSGSQETATNADPGRGCDP